MTFDGAIYTLSSGRSFSANCGIIGIGPHHPSDTSEFTEGYDGGVMILDESTFEPSPFTASEAAEIADFMIARWSAWREAALSR